MKFYTEEIMTMKDGSAPKALNEYESEKQAISAFHQIMASVYINENIKSAHVEAKNSFGGIYESKTYMNEAN